MFVLSSDYEGLSNALLEAMMLGIPCISTRCAGSDEHITNKHNGILIDIGDQDALVSAMNELHSNPQYAETIGENAVSYSECFARKNVISSWCDIIEA